MSNDQTHPTKPCPCDGTPEDAMIKGCSYHWNRYQYEQRYGTIPAEAKPDWGHHIDKGPGATHFKGDDCEPSPNPGELPDGSGEKRSQVAEIMTDAHTSGHWTCEQTECHQGGSPINRMMALMAQPPAPTTEAKTVKVHDDLYLSHLGTPADGMGEVELRQQLADLRLNDGPGIEGRLGANMEPEYFEALLNFITQREQKAYERGIKTASEAHADGQKNFYERGKAVGEHKLKLAVQAARREFLEALELDNLRVQAGGIFSPIADEIERRYAVLTNRNPQQEDKV